MNSFIERKYLDKIRANRDMLISELTDEFGIEYKELLEERFDKIRFIFFASIANLNRYITKKYSYYVAKKILRYLRENTQFDDLYISEKYKNDYGFTIASSYRTKEFTDFFGTSWLFFDYEKPRENPISNDSVFCFDIDQDSESLKEYCYKEGIKVEEFVRSKKCDFLRRIGKYPPRYTDEMIINDENYPSICKNYEKFVKRYNRILEDAKKQVEKEVDALNKLNEKRDRLSNYYLKKLMESLTSLMTREDQKKIQSGNYNLNDIEFYRTFFYRDQNISEKCRVDESSRSNIERLMKNYYEPFRRYDVTDLITSVKRVKQWYMDQYFVNIANVFVFETNADLKKITIDHDLSTFEHQAEAALVSNNGEEICRIILFDPFFVDNDALDVILRHEIRHSLTSCVIDNGYGDSIVKMGNAEYVHFGNMLHHDENVFYNELITQRRAIDVTKKSFKNGRYIFTSEGTKFPKYYTTIYDMYLRDFDKLLKLLPERAMKSQIEDNNDELYQVLTHGDIKRIEESLIKSFGIPQDIIARLKYQNKLENGPRK